jgi:RNA polymerase sigma-70 factor (ECF subfamily)
VPFDDIATVVGRSPAAARQLASRGRRRVQNAAAFPDADLGRQRELVDAFLAAARAGDFAALLAVLDPDVVVRSDGGALLPGASRVLRGARAVAGQALFAAQLGLSVQPARVNGAAGLVSWDADGRPFSVMGFTVAGGRIVAIDVLLDPERLVRLNLTSLKA